MSVLLTGATGFVGMEILARYLERTDATIDVAVRAHDEAEAAARVAGQHGGEFGEDEFDNGQSFRNAYEQSKFEAERLVRAHARGLPIQIFRPSIVVGEQSTGWTPPFNLLYTPLKAFVRGKLPALPAKRTSPVDVVPVDYVADAIFELSDDASCGTWHLVAGPGATTVGRLIELTSD